MLGAALHLGQGVAADQDEAYTELTLATRRGSLLAARFLPSVRDRLTPKAAQEAERRAGERLAADGGGTQGLGTRGTQAAA